MSAPINNQFAGGYQINEKEGSLNEFWSSIETDTNPMTNLEGEELKADGGWMYASFEENATTKVSPKVEEEWNPDDVLSVLEDDDIDVVAEVSHEWEEVVDQEDNIEVKSVDTEHCVFGPTIDSCVRPGGLTPEEWREAKIALTWLAEWADIGKELSKANISPIHKWKLTEVVEHLVDPETKEKNKENFLKDFWIRLEDFKQDNPEWEKEFWTITQQAVDRLWSNYFVNLDAEGVSLDSWEGLEKAFATSIIEISLKADETTVAYQEIVNDIKNSEKSFEERFKRLVELEDYANTEVVKWGKKNKEDLMAAKKRSTTNNNAVDAFRESQQARAVSEAELLANNVALEASEILNAPEESGWDVFAASWELDTISSAAA